MDYPPTTQELREKVRRQMEDEAKRQLGRVNRMAGAEGHHTGPALSEGGHTRADTSLSQWRVIRVRPSLKIADGGRK